MAIAALGTMGVAAGFASNTSGALTTATTALAAGDFGLMIVATDNINTGSTDANNNEHTSVTGGTGTWTKLGEWANNNGGAASGVTVSVWLFEASGTNAIGTVFTINFSSALVEKAVTMYAFSKAAGTSIVLDTTASPNPITSAADASNDFASVSFSGLASVARLYFRGLGKEANSAIAITPSTNFTETGRTRSQNAASAVIVRGEFRINTSTGETSNPTLAASGDTAGLFLALIESTSGSAADTLGAATSTSSSAMGITGTAADTLGAVSSTGTGDGTSAVRSTGMLPHRGSRRRGRPQ